MLRLGMPSLIETETLEDCAALCRELGLSFVELNMNLPQYQPGRLEPEHLRQLAEENGLFFTLHLDENLNVSDPNPYVAEAYGRTALESIGLARDLGLPCVNMHLPRGVHFTLPEGKVYLFDRYREPYLRSIEDFRRRCQEAVGASPLRICIENCDGFLDFQQEALELLLASPAFGLTLDVGHNHSCGGLDEDLILARKDRLRHLHLHDALGRQNHLPLGAGEVELPRFLTLAQEQDCTVVLETKTIAALRQSVLWLRQRGYLY